MAVGITVTSAASSHRLTTVDAVQTELDISSDSTFIGTLIDQASARIEKAADRVFAKETVEEERGASGTRYMYLTRFPIVSVDSVEHDGDSVTDYTVFDTEKGLLYRENGWTNTQLYWNFITDLYTGFRDPDWKITYTAGYVLPGDSARDLPDDLEMACIQFVKSLYLQRDTDPALTREQYGDASQSWERNSQLMGMPPITKTIVDNYSVTTVL